jgi:hypothetical protein
MLWMLWFLAVSSFVSGDRSFVAHHEAVHPALGEHSQSLLEITSRANFSFASTAVGDRQRLWGALRGHAHRRQGSKLAGIRPGVPISDHQIPLHITQRMRSGIR